MNRLGCSVFFAIGVLAAAGQDLAKNAPLVRDVPTVAKLIALRPDRFHALDTDHFTIVTDAPHETIRPLTARLESTHAAIMRFCAAMKLPIKPLPTRLAILLFDRFDEFVAYAEKAGVSPGTAAGFYDQSTNVAAFANVLNGPALAPLHREIESLNLRLRALLRRSTGSATATSRGDDLTNRIHALRSQQDAFVERFNRLVLQHEAAHQVFFNVGVHVRGADNPIWLVEGLACQFEVPQSDLGGDLKSVNQMRLGDLREALRVARDVRDEAKIDFRAVCESGSLMPLAELVVADSLSGADSTASAARYAQAWSLVYFLQKDRRDAFSTYLARFVVQPAGEVFDSKAELGAFQRVFGPLDDWFVRDWLGLSLRLRFEHNDP